MVLVLTRPRLRPQLPSTPPCPYMGVEVVVQDPNAPGHQSPGCGVGFMATYADELGSPSAGDSPPCPFLELYREYLRFISRLEAAEKVLDRHRTSNVAI